MKNCNAPGNQTTRRILPIASATALAVAFTVSLSQPAHAYDSITPPRVPTSIQVPEGNKVFFVGHATGTQNYICLPSGREFKFKLFTPQATLFNDIDRQATTHYFGPNPFEGGTIRATWQHSRDTSTVWGKVVEGDSATVRPDAIDWLKVTVVKAEEGPTGGDTLARTTFIQRVNTTGGLAPPTGCSSPAEVGTQAFVPYTADYFFYTDRYY